MARFYSGCQIKWFPSARYDEDNGRRRSKNHFGNSFEYTILYMYKLWICYYHVIIHTFVLLYLLALCFVIQLKQLVGGWVKCQRSPTWHRQEPYTRRLLVPSCSRTAIWNHHLSDTDSLSVYDQWSIAISGNSQLLYYIHPHHGHHDNRKNVSKHNLGTISLDRNCYHTWHDLISWYHMTT